MTKEEVISKLKQFIADFPGSYCRKIRMKGNEDFYAEVLKYIPEKVKPQKYDLRTKIYWLLNNIVDFPRCIVCEKELSDKNIKNIYIGYHKCCSQKCAKASDVRKLKYEETCLRRFGVKNASQSNMIKDKKKNTCLQHFNVENPAKSNEIKDKTKKTVLERYNKEYIFQTEQAKTKTRQTMLKKYNVEHPLLNRELRLKAQQRYRYNGIGFDSKPELALYIFLSENNFDFEYQPDIQFEYSCNGHKYFYSPDFKISGKIYEVKGKHFFKTDGTMCNPWDHSLDAVYEAKHKCMIANNVTILLDDCDYIDNCYKFIYEKYGKDYLSKFRKNDSKQH